MLASLSQAQKGKTTKHVSTGIWKQEMNEHVTTNVGHLFDIRSIFTLELDMFQRYEGREPGETEEPLMLMSMPIPAPTPPTGPEGGTCCPCLLLSMKTAGLCWHRGYYQVDCACRGGNSEPQDPLVYHKDMVAELVEVVHQAVKCSGVKDLT